MAIHEPEYLIEMPVQGTPTKWLMDSRSDEWRDFTIKRHYATRYKRSQLGEVVTWVFNNYPLAVIRIEHV